MVGLVAVIGTAVVAVGHGNLASAFAAAQSEKALYAAEAGAWLGVVEATKNPLWNGFNRAVRPMTNGPETYQVDVYRSGETVNGLTVPPGLTYVLATGRARNGLSRQVGMMIQTGVGALDYAVMAKETILVRGGSAIDSRDPVTGDVLPDPASVATYAVADGSIVVDGGSFIHGDAMAGPNAPGTAVVESGGSDVTGVIGNLTAQGVVPLDPVALPDDPTLAAGVTVTNGATDALTPGTYGDLVVNGGAHPDLAPGVYTLNS